MISLVSLVVSHNHLRSFPQSMKNLVNLKILKFDGNDLALDFDFFAKIAGFFLFFLSFSSFSSLFLLFSFSFSFFPFLFFLVELIFFNFFLQVISQVMPISHLLINNPWRSYSRQMFWIIRKGTCPNFMPILVPSISQNFSFLCFQPFLF